MSRGVGIILLADWGPESNTAMSTSMYSPLHPEPSSLDEIQRYIQAEDELEKPLVFAKKDAFTRYVACGELF